MQIQRHTPNTKESTIALRDSKPGDCIRFAVDSFEDAIRTNSFWLRLNAPETKDRVRLANLHDGSQLERDGDHRVIVHASVLNVIP